MLDNKSRKFKTIITAPNKVQYTTKTTKLKEASYYAFNRNPEGGEVRSSLLLDWIRLLDYSKDTSRIRGVFSDTDTCNYTTLNYVIFSNY